MPTKSQEESISSMKLTSGGFMAGASRPPSSMRRSQLNAVFDGQENAKGCRAKGSHTVTRLGMQAPGGDE